MYRILYVDDEPDLLEIGKIFLEQSGQFIVDTAISAPAALVLLRSTSYDAIIADYQMPEMDGIDFLKTIRSSGNTIPFILFTGRGREEVVIQALNEGADFYLHKGGEPRSQFAELSNKVYYAVMRRRAEESLKQNEAQLRQIIDLVPHMIFANDWNGNFLLVNRALAQRYNTTVADLAGKSLAHFHSDAAGLQHMLDDNREVMTTGTIKFIPNEPCIDASGNHRILQTTKVPFTTLGNNQQAVLGIAIDITERKESEMELRGAYEQIIAQEVELRGQYEAMVTLQQRTAESQRVLSNIIDFLPDATFAIDTAGKVLSWNKAIETMTGIQKEDILGKGDFCYALPFYGEMRPMLINLILHFDETFANENYPYVKRVGETLFSEACVPRLREETGTHLWFTASPLYSKDGVLAGAIESIRDITPFKQTEQALTATKKELQQNYDELAKSQKLLEESEKKYRDIVEDQTEFICRFLPDGTHVFVNDAYCRYFGLKREEILGHRFRPVVPAEDGLRIMEILASLTPENPVKFIRQRVIFSEGNVRWQRWSCRAIYDDTGNLVEYQLVGRDITDVITAERALLESEQRYRNVVEDQTEFICRFLPDGTHVFVNDAYCRYFCLKREEIVGHRFRPSIPVEDQERVKQFFASLTRDRPINSIEHRIIMPDGALRWQRWSDRAIFNPSGTIVEYQSVGLDITEEKATQKALESSETRFREQYQSNPLAIFTWQHRDGDFVLVDCNRAAEILTCGRSRAYLGTTAAEFYATRPELISEIRQCFSERTAISGEHVSEHFLPGRLIHITAAFVPPDLILIHMEDITERKKAEEALKESQRMLTEAMDLANLVTWECDLRTGILTFDDRFSTLYGTAVEQKGISHMTADAYLRDLVHPEDRGILDEEDENSRKTTDPNYVSKREYRIIHRDGRVRHIEMCVGITKDEKGQTIKTHGVNQDITERKKTEEALRQANRQLSLLSGITRHDILNKITGILGYLQLAEMKSSDTAIDAYLGKMESAVREIQSQIEFTQIYQDLGTNEPQWIELDEVMPHSHTLLTVSLHNEVQGVEVFADPMLEKIFTNLLDNSLRHGQRVTTIRVSSHEAGGDLVVVWEDDGIGIAADEKERIFERGFGKNSGFGLFLIREILSLTGITIQETGEPGKGARFEILIPKMQYRLARSLKK